jgi:hypothetical protein
MAEEAQVPAEVPAEEEKKEEEKKQEKTLAEALAVFPGSPSQQEIEGWKQAHGEIFCSAFSEVELYVWRPVNRIEFVTMQTQLAMSQEQVTQFNVEEDIVKRCLLWASPLGVSGLETKAGSLTSLHEQIMQNSNFMDPRVAAQLVIKL